MKDYLLSYIVIYWAIVIRYAFFATAFYLIYYKFFRQKLAFSKIQSKWPSKSDFKREISYSLITVLFFAIIGVLIFKSPLTTYSKIYFDFNEMPLWYYIVSFPIMLIVHDTYFYWMHRTLHHPLLFKTTHLIHHKSTNPSPWAAYAFHPIEAFLEAAILPILAFSMPLHFSAFGIFFLFQILYNVYGHSGFELYPKGFEKHWFGKWMNTSVHHNLHHKNFDNSYGLYFTFWDRLMGTMAPQYDESFNEVKSRVALKVR